MTTQKQKPAAKPKPKGSFKTAFPGTKPKFSKHQDKVKQKGSKGKPKPAGASAPKPKPPLPLPDDQLGPIPGIPTEAEIDQQVAALTPPDRAVLGKIRQLVAQHLGSHAAARLWLVTPGNGFEGTPLGAIREGRGSQILTVLNAQWGKNPTYA